MNVFVKPNDQSDALYWLWHGEKRSDEIQGLIGVFVSHKQKEYGISKHSFPKPAEQLLVR